MEQEELDSIQNSVLNTPVDNNSLLVYSNVERKNKSLNPNFFTSASRTIINAINRVYSMAKSAVSTSSEAVSTIKNLVGDIEDYDTNQAFENLKSATGKQTIIQMMNDINQDVVINSTFGGVIYSLSDMNGENSKVYYYKPDNTFYYWDGLNYKVIASGEELEENPIDFSTEW